MVDTQHEFLQRNDHAGNDYALFYTIYQRKDIVPGATLLVLHGMQEHSGRMTNSRDIWRSGVLWY